MPDESKPYLIVLRPGDTMRIQSEDGRVWMHLNRTSGHIEFGEAYELNALLYNHERGSGCNMRFEVETRPIINSSHL